MELPIELNGQPQTAHVSFVTGSRDFRFLSEWQKTLDDDRNPIRTAAVELAQVAVHRYEAHSAIDIYAESIDDFADHILVNPKCEIAALVLLTCEAFSDSKVIALAHFRRTWNNNLVLDYLTAHPFIAKHKEGYAQNLRGAGRALLYFLSGVAKRCGCGSIWGEATPTSCTFYKHQFSLPSVEDLILAPISNVLGFIDRFDKERAGKDSAIRPKSESLEESYAVEAKDTPFMGSRTAVFNPKRLLAYHFLDLPHHVQITIAEALSLLQDEDRGQPAPEQFRRIFQRATEGGRLPHLWREVEKRHPEGRPETNPFPTSSDKESE
jgi:hypothetical protein